MEARSGYLTLCRRAAAVTEMGGKVMQVLQLSPDLPIGS